MEQMRNVRTGKLAVYDAELVKTGRWEIYTPKTKAPKKKPWDEECLGVSDVVSIVLKRGNDESIERQA